MAAAGIPAAAGFICPAAAGFTFQTAAGFTFPAADSVSFTSGIRGEGAPPGCEPTQPATAPAAAAADAAVADFLGEKSRCMRLRKPLLSAQSALAAPSTPADGHCGDLLCATCALPSNSSTRARVGTAAFAAGERILGCHADNTSAATSDMPAVAVSAPALFAAFGDAGADTGAGNADAVATGRPAAAAPNAAEAARPMAPPSSNESRSDESRSDENRLPRPQTARPAAAAGNMTSRIMTSSPPSPSRSLKPLPRLPPLSPPPLAGCMLDFGESAAPLTHVPPPSPPLPSPPSLHPSVVAATRGRPSDGWKSGPVGVSPPPPHTPRRAGLLLLPAALSPPSLPPPSDAAAENDGSGGRERAHLGSWSGSSSVRPCHGSGVRSLVGDGESICLKGEEA
eukprot:353571-Chlamydomonas_euryale.AAC.1